MSAWQIDTAANVRSVRGVRRCEVEETGGGVRVVVATLHDGTTVVGTDESVCTYVNTYAWEDGDDPTMVVTLHGAQDDETGETLPLAVAQAMADVIAHHRSGPNYTARITGNGREDTPRAPRWVGVVHMGPNYSDPDVACSAYVWDTLEAVGDSVALASRGLGIGARVAEWADDGSAVAGNFDDSGTPCTRGVFAIVWRNIPGTLENAEREGFVMADRIVWRGPRGAIRSGDVEACWSLATGSES